MRKGLEAARLVMIGTLAACAVRAPIVTAERQVSRCFDISMTGWRVAAGRTGTPGPDIRGWLLLDTARVTRTDTVFHYGVVAPDSAQRGLEPVDTARRVAQLWYAGDPPRREGWSGWLSGWKRVPGDTIEVFLHLFDGASRLRLVPSPTGLRGIMESISHGDVMQVGHVEGQPGECPR